MMESIPRSRNWLRIGLGLAGALVAAFAIVKLGGRASEELPRFVAWVESLGPWGPVVFVLGYALLVVAAVPGSVLTIASGAIFGVGRGTLLVFLAATLGANLCFLIARYVARGWVAKRIPADSRFAEIDRAVAKEGRKIVFLLRLAPTFPFNVLNYGLGLTQVRFLDHLVASIGMLPGTLLYVYLGSLGGDALSGGRNLPLKAALFAVTAVLVVLAVRTARKALREATAQ